MAQPAIADRSDVRVTVAISLTVGAIIPVFGIVFGVGAIWQSVRLLRLSGYSAMQRRAAFVTLPVAMALTTVWLLFVAVGAWYNSG